MVYSSSAVSAYVNFNDSYYFLKRQLVWVSLGFLAMLFTMSIDYHVWRNLAKPIMIGTLILLVLVLIPGFGKVVNGARRWLGFGSLYVQPSEFAKLSMVLFCADSLSRYQDRITSFVKGMMPHLLVLMLIFGLILKEPDLGTALVIGGTVFILLFSAGAKISHLVSLGITGVAGIIVAIIAEPYRLKRLLAFSDPWADPLNTGYHIIQSLYAIGSGGLFGVGLGRSREKFLYLPEPHTDFIFAAWSEEHGLVGALGVLLLYFMVLMRLVANAQTAPDRAGTFVVMGVVAVITFHILINVGMVVGFAPVTGIPLPLMSYGGSSVLFTFLALGIVMNIRMRRFVN
jgi:cell division protein FtsW